jgi:hypothetical protein
MTATKTRLEGRDIAIGCALAALAFTVAADVRVPILAYVDLGFHELGHFLTYWLPDLLTAMAGSFLQVAVPSGLAAYFYFWQSDRAASGLCLGWAATAAADAARYIADAPYERLPLLGGDHDWAFVLSETNLIHRAALFATLVRIAAWVMVLGGAALLAAPYVRAWLRDGRF